MTLETPEMLRLPIKVALVPMPTMVLWDFVKTRLMLMGPCTWMMRGPFMLISAVKSPALVTVTTGPPAPPVVVPLTMAKPSGPAAARRVHDKRTRIGTSIQRTTNRQGGAAARALRASRPAFGSSRAIR